MKSIIIAALVAALVSATAATAASGLITGAQIKNGSIGLVDLSANAKRALKGQRGPQGPAGVPGAQGIPGGFDPAKVTYQQGTNLSIAPNTGGSATVNCPTGAVAISGGWVVVTGGVGEVWTSRSFGGGSWTINVWNHSDFTAAEVTPFAVCAAR